MAPLEGARSLFHEHELRSRVGCPQPAGPRRGENTATYQIRFMVQCAVIKPWRLSMNRTKRSDSFVLHMRHEIVQSGSWSQCATKKS